jgi:acyl-coenzyme A synthetase/AMP-(fatty) acid ligase/acyl carrier protein
VAQIQSIVFDASTVEIFGALLNGVSLFIIDKTTVLDPSELDDVFTKNNITVAAFSSALFAQLAESHSEIFRNLRYLQVGGDVLSAPHAKKVRDINPELRFVNVYGPTENSCISTYYDIDKDYENNVPIGKPISNSTAYIFDNNMNYQPVGIIGELYVGGEGLSKGYLNRDDLNQISFIDHPFNPGKRLYKTGDLARWLPDGNIEFHGRIDTQVKIRGYRIELREIETVLAEMEGISDAAVKAIVISANDTRLVAFLKVTEGVRIDFTQISDHLRRKMPSYMVPSAYRTVSSFPMTINGKIDMNALSIDLSHTNGEKTRMSKELNPTQKRIAKIWEDLIKTSNISLNDNFFDIGGTSLIAIRAVERIEKEFKIKLSARVFFDCPKIKCMAEHIDSKISEKSPASYEYPQIKSGRIVSREF